MQGLKIEQESLVVYGQLGLSCTLSSDSHWTVLQGVLVSALVPEIEVLYLQCSVTNTPQTKKLLKSEHTCLPICTCSEPTKLEVSV